MMTSNKHDWSTPDSLYNELDEEFHFTCDVAASDWNAKHSSYFDEVSDGLSREWNGVCWMNPPYGREISKWVEKAHNESQRGVVVVCLLPARTDTHWWHTWVMGHEIRFLRGRVHFSQRDGSSGPAPFPSAVVVMRRRNA